MLEEKVGPVRVGVRLDRRRASARRVRCPTLPDGGGRSRPAELLAAALGLIPSEIGFENHRPTRYTAGNAFVFVPVSTLEAMAKARVSSTHWSKAFTGQGGVGAFLYTRQVVHTTSAFHARMFAPDHGVAEDPATGSAAAAFAGVVQHFDAPTDGTPSPCHRAGLRDGPAQPHYALAGGGWGPAGGGTDRRACGSREPGHDRGLSWIRACNRVRSPAI